VGVPIQKLEVFNKGEGCIGAKGESLRGGIIKNGKRSIQENVGDTNMKRGNPKSSRPFSR